MNSFLNKNKKIISLIVVFGIFILPNLVFAQDSVSSLVPACGGKNQKECGYYDLFQLIQNVINWIIQISIPVSAGIFAYAGILYMTHDVAGKKEQAKTMMKNTFWGFVIILSAWLIVSTILSTLLSPYYQDAIPLQDFQKSSV